MKSNVASFLLALLLLNSSAAFAKDNLRKGFVFGVAAGIGSTADFLNSENIPHKGLVGLQTDLKIGEGLTEQLLIHYSGKQFWYQSDGQTYVAAFPGMGVTYYLLPQTPTFYFGGSLGLGFGAGSQMWGFGGYSLSFAQTGWGGYEFARHVSVEFSLSHTSYGPWGQHGRNLWNTSLTLNLLSY